MAHSPERDVHALELGFLSYAVISALRTLQEGQTISDLDNEQLQEASMFLRSLSEWAGPAIGGQSASLRLSALTSFGYAVEAMRSLTTGKMTDGMRGFLERLASGLDTIRTGGKPDESVITEEIGFFEALGGGTLDRWHAAQAPTIIAPQTMLAAQ